MSQAPLAPLIRLKTETFRANIRKEKTSKIFDNKRLKFQSSHFFLQKDDFEASAIKKETPLISFEAIIQNKRKALFKALKDQSNEYLILSFRDIRKLMNSAIEERSVDFESKLFDSELISAMVNLVVPKNFKNLELMEEIFWIMINFSTIANHSLMNFFKGSMMIKTCIDIVFSDESEILIHNALWLMGNMVEEIDGMSKGLLEKNIMERIQELIEKSEKPLDLQKDLVFLLQNISNSSPSLTYSEMRKYVPLMVNYLNKVDDWEVQYCCLSALSFICIKMLQMDSEMLLLFINDIKQCKGYEAIAFLAEKALTINPGEGEQLLTRVTKVLGTLANGDSKEIQFLFDKGIVDLIHHMLEHRSMPVRRNSAWILSNLLAGDCNQVSHIFLNDGLINKLLFMLATSDAIDLKINIFFCFLNSMSKLSEFSFDKLLKKGLLKIMIDQLDVNGVVDFLEALLEGIDYFLMFGAEVSGSDQANFMISIFASYGGLQKLDQLQYHVDERIFNRVSSIVDKYFQQLD